MFLKFSLSVISLCRYPNLVLMDATYKTCKLALPLFFLVVHMNVGYSVVAEFIIQHEDTTSITEALQILRKRWDECDIEVGNFMIDCQQSEGMQYMQFSPTVLCICAHSTDFRRGSGGSSTPKTESATIKRTVWHF